MRFLVDNALSPALAAGLSEAGHPSVHLCEYGMGSSPDEEVFARASAEERHLISADTDFAAILAKRGASRPSVILFRGEGVHRPHQQLMLLLTNLSRIAAALEEGSLVVIERTRIRIRRLPITGA